MIYVCMYMCVCIYSGFRAESNSLIANTVLDIESSFRKFMWEGLRPDSIVRKIRSGLDAIQI